MIGKFFLVFLVVTTAFSCKKDSASKDDMYIASASKIIDLGGSNWNNTEPQLKRKIGYRYEAAPPNVSAFHKAEVHLSAIDDSSRTEGEVYLHIANSNIIDRALYAPPPLSQSAAYAMMLNYNNESLKIPGGVTPLQGQYIENGTGGLTSVNAILTKIKNGQAADNLLVTYAINGRGTTIQIGVHRINDGRYEFGFVCSP
jgi:hypothetical protein